MKLLNALIVCLILLIGSSCRESSKNSGGDIKKEVDRQAKIVEGKRKIEKPSVSLTFDDGMTNDIVDYKFEDWNQLILNALEEADLKSMFFVSGYNKTSKKGKYLLSEWDRRGHKIANHTFSHPNFNDKNNTIEDFEDELMQTDAIINKYTNYVKYFRFPYLKEGKTKEKIEGMRAVLQKEEYKNGYVTIDASDWYVSSRLIDKMKSEADVDTMAFQDYYLIHIIDRAKFYESLSFKLTGRHIKHTLLLHHNLTSALFLESLIDRFEAEGWDVIDAVEAYKDPIYQSRPMVVPAGESLIWSLTKESCKYEDILRYPAEDSRYERVAMNRLGL